MKQSAVLVALILSCCFSAQAADYKVQTRYPVPGNEGWDYISIDSTARRLYVSHSVRVNVLDADTGTVVGTIEDTPGIHGIAIASKLKHGFTSNGKEDKVTMFDTGTLSVIKKIDVGKGPDGIYFDPGSQRVFTNNHHSHDITAIDAATGNVTGTVDVGGNGEGAAVGKDGLIYVALEDKNEVAVFDPKTLEVKQHFPLEDVKAPTGLAVDAKSDRVFVGGHNKTMEVLDGTSGKKIASLPTGSGTDAAGFDAKKRLIFFSNGEGNLTVIREKSANDYAAEDSVTTQPSAKTMAFDSKTGKIFLSAATVVSTPSADPAQKPKKTITDGTFCVLVVGK
ncbi:YncE family protein [Paracidobacterium acidisoli]|uniref:YncE family protein n=1 Tax=Paracidobacterium acidisoli TaxID=2303751 RepID=A0A372ISF5_9BACT|nr:YncE family protein [Paracidobacterium acidisoli]MBT9330613.1 YncE family protein [Paracidobacterium acidisoli]